MLSRGLQDNARDVSHILFVHGGVIGQEEAAMMYAVCHREAGLPVAVHPERMKPQIAGGENSRFHPFCNQCPDNPTALFRRICEQPEGDAGNFAPCRRPLSVKPATQVLQSPFVIGLPSAVHPVQLVQLLDADEGVEIGRAEIEARLVKHKRRVEIVNLVLRQ